jgi:hypothetical protein
MTKSHFLGVIIVSSVFICDLFGVYQSGSFLWGALGIVLSFGGATAFLVIVKWPAIHVYKTGKEYEPEKTRTKIGARPASQREMDKLNPILEQIA